MTLVYILSGILLLGALSYLGIRREKQERLRFEREELAQLEGEQGGKGAEEQGSNGDFSPAPPLLRPSAQVHLGTNGRDPLLWQPLELPNPHLLIVGGSGSGKSQTLKAIAHELREAMLAGEAPPGKLRTMLVIDEAKLLALRGKGDPLGVLNRLATEARKYGLGLLLASQSLPRT